MPKSCAHRDQHRMYYTVHVSMQYAVCMLVCISPLRCIPHVLHRQRITLQMHLSTHIMHVTVMCGITLNYCVSASFDDLPTVHAKTQVNSLIRYAIMIM